MTSSPFPLSIITIPATILMSLQLRDHVEPDSVIPSWSPSCYSLSFLSPFTWSVLDCCSSPLTHVPHILSLEDVISGVRYDGPIQAIISIQMDGGIFKFSPHLMSQSLHFNRYIRLFHFAISVHLRSFPIRLLNTHNILPTLNTQRGGTQVESVEMSIQRISDISGHEDHRGILSIKMI